MVIYFSGTGNSKYITDRIAGGLQEKLLSMNERIKSGNTGSVKTGENLIVVVPTYAWRIPRVVSDWIGQTEFVGAKNVWYVMSCGSGIGGADIYNRKLSEKKGIKHMGTAQIIMPENYIAMFNAPDVEKAKKIVVAAGPAIAKAVLAIKHGEHLPERKYGLGGRMESGLVNSVFYPVFVKAKAFISESEKKDLLFLRQGICITLVFSYQNNGHFKSSIIQSWTAKVHDHHSFRFWTLTGFGINCGCLFLLLLFKKMLFSAY